VAARGGSCAALLRKTFAPAQTSPSTINWQSGSTPILAGSWRGGDLANKINAVHIPCDASQKNCDLQQADVMSLGGGPLLSMYSKSFRITKVDDQSVVAEALPDVCIRQTLTFDRAAKAVTMVRTKINREDACSIMQEKPLSLYLGEPLR
jgi:hypothetical protein